MRRALDGSFDLLGQRYPVVVGLITAVTLVGSIAGAVMWRAGVPLLGQVGLVPTLVLLGQAWRLVTWSFFELDPLQLFFACLMLMLIGRDLCHAWGPRRFLALYVGGTFVTGLVTTLIARLLWHDTLDRTYLTAWPMIDALIVAWALLFPHRTIFMMFVLPVSGRNLIYVVFGLIALLALMGGPGGYVAHFIAPSLALVYLRDPVLYERWLRLRMWWMGRGQRAPRRPTYIRPVERDDDDRPRWTH